MHDHSIPGLKPKFSVLVTSGTRTKDTDTSGKPLIEFIKNQGFEVTGYDVIPDDIDYIRDTARSLLRQSDALVISGGTGISARDFTVQAIAGISTKAIPGFSTVFSAVSYEEIGTKAIMSGASAFVVDNKPVFCLPGSPSGAMTGVKRIIIPEIDHILHELRK